MDNSTPPLMLGRSFWAIDPEVLPRLIEAHRSRNALASFASRLDVQEPSEHKPDDRAGGAVAVIPLQGVLTPRMSLLSLLFGGGGGLVDFRESFRAAVRNPDVGSIVLDVDSPGGLVDLIPETAAEVRAARGVKPIVAAVNTLSASAAYWIASQADEIVVTPSGAAGSIGVYMVHEDWSGANEKEGIIPTYVSAGKYKTEGNPDQPLSKEAREDWQREVDLLYSMFVDAVAAGRGVTEQAVRNGYGEGRVLRAEHAVDVGLVDRVDTIEGVIGGLLTDDRGGVRVRMTPNEARVQAGLKVSESTAEVQTLEVALHAPSCNTLCDPDGLHFLVGDVDDENRCKACKPDCLLEDGHEGEHAFLLNLSGQPDEEIVPPEEDDPEIDENEVVPPEETEAKPSLPFDLQFVD